MQENRELLLDYQVNQRRNLNHTYADIIGKETDD